MTMSSDDEGQSRFSSERVDASPLSNSRGKDEVNAEEKIALLGSE